MVKDVYKTCQYFLNDSTHQHSVGLWGVCTFFWAASQALLYRLKVDEDVVYIYIYVSQITNE